MDIAKIDKNFKVETSINKSDIKFYDVKNEPFKVYGVFHENGRFMRVPQAIAENVNEGVKGLSKHTAGGRIRFKTNSPYVAINAKMSVFEVMSNMAHMGACGFDLYIKDGSEEIYFHSFMPPINMKDGYESIVDFGNEELKEITINMPLYGGVEEVYIGVSENAQVIEPQEYANSKPIVYYGSSITQGGCASRPGSTYQARIMRELDIDYINLGFSGSAKGEDEIAKYIANLDMSLFVYDYDYNAPSLEHLENTHERMFKIIRKENPNLPILILSRPQFSLSVAAEERYKVIEKTYKNAKSNGDNNVYLIKGTKLMEMVGYEGTIDNCHPTDLGFASMADVIGKEIRKILNI